MSLLNENGPVLVKARELCQTLLSDPGYEGIRRRIDTFMADEAARNEYNDVGQARQNLQQKQQSGMELTDQEIEAFESLREKLLTNHVVRDFLDAQEEIQEVRKTITLHVMKTFELGRMPEAGDFQSCGHGCSCH